MVQERMVTNPSFLMTFCVVDCILAPLASCVRYVRGIYAYCGLKPRFAVHNLGLGTKKRELRHIRVCDAVHSFRRSYAVFEENPVDIGACAHRGGADVNH